MIYEIWLIQQKLATFHQEVKLQQNMTLFLKSYNFTLGHLFQLSHMTNVTICCQNAPTYQGKCLL